MVTVRTVPAALLPAALLPAAAVLLLLPAVLPLLPVALLAPRRVVSTAVPPVPPCARPLAWE